MSKLVGTFECPICGLDEPHEHSGEEVHHWHEQQGRDASWAAAFPKVKRYDLGEVHNGGIYGRPDIEMVEVTNGPLVYVEDVIKALSALQRNPEFCAHCGGKLDSVRMIVPLRSPGGWWGPDHATVHPHCCETFQAAQARLTAPTTYTGNRSEPSP